MSAAACFPIVSASGYVRKIKTIEPFSVYGLSESIWLSCSNPPAAFHASSTAPLFFQKAQAGASPLN